MKKIVCLLLALVLVLALAGCRVSNRPYRRYATPYDTNYRTYNNYDGTYRSNVRPRFINPGDAPLYDGSTNGTGTRSPVTGSRVVPSPAVPLPTATATVPGTTVNPNRTFNVPS